MSAERARQVCRRATARRRRAPTVRASQAVALLAAGGPSDGGGGGGATANARVPLRVGSGGTVLLVIPRACGIALSASKFGASPAVAGDFVEQLLVALPLLRQYLQKETPTLRL